MIRIMLFDTATSEFQQGGVELLTVWRERPESVIWADFGDNPLETERAVLLEQLGLHPLAVQDAQRDRHPPKIEAFGNYVFLLFKGMDEITRDIDFGTIQLALFVSKRFFVTRHSGPSPSTNQLWDEICEDPSGFLKGTDTFALRLIRIMIGRYLKVVLALEPRLETLEHEMIDKPRDAILAELIGYKTNLKKLRRIFLYHQQVLADLKHGTFTGIGAERNHEINDVYEQQERANSLTTLYYELASDLIDGYLSLTSHRLNQIMKVLTIVMAIFVPLSFLAGIYGMNFENMPELHSKSGYFILLGIMASIAVMLLYIFRKLRWL